MNLDGKVALVTGSSQGIGKAIAIRLAQQGADVAINYRSDPEGGAETVKAVEAAGKRCYTCSSPVDGYSIQADVSVMSEVNDLVRQSVEHFGKLDILVNNAGVEANAPFWEITEADYDKAMDVNLKGAFFAAQALVKHLRETQRGGRIINISSVHEELPFPNFTAYCCSKGGMKMLARNLAVELGPLGITVNNIAPGAIETPINTDLLNDKQKLNALLKNIPLGRLGQPEDVSNLAAFLASDEAAYITGATFFVDGGLLWNYQEQ